MPELQTETALVEAPMDSDHFRQIRTPFHRKARLIHALLRFIDDYPGAVPPEKAVFEKFVTDFRSSLVQDDRPSSDQWLPEHAARLFWVCCELGLLKYQYPYPHKGQTYLLTRIGQLLARAPKFVVTAFLAAAYLVAVTAGPVKHFHRIRNVATILTGAFMWWRQQELTPLLVVVSIGVGVITTWIASFLSSVDL